MKKYGILIQPSFNKVFFESSRELMQCELQILDQMVLHRDFHEFRIETTKLMLNIAVFCSDFASGFTDRLVLLDPVCGRGTTLFQGLIYGYDVAGVEADKKSTHTLMTFLKRYLMEKHYKHQLEQARFLRGGKVAGSSFKLLAAQSKEEFKDHPVVIQVVQDDTQYANEHFKQNSFHVIVGDLPYGVQHGSPGNLGSLTRNPIGMIETALPAWINLLKPGGVVAVAWNTRILPRPKLEGIFTGAGLKVLHSDALDRLVHVVDASITRDLLIARKE